MDREVHSLGGTMVAAADEALELETAGDGGGVATPGSWLIFCKRSLSSAPPLDEEP